MRALARIRSSCSRSLVAWTLACSQISVAVAGQAVEQHSESVSARPIAVEAFHDPRPKTIYEPTYPLDSDGPDGWAILSLMVDPTGKPFEAAVVSSTGNKTFDGLAVRSIERSTFVPASVNGQPIESAYEIKFTFVNRGRSVLPGASRDFNDGWKRVQAALRTGDRQAVDADMQKLQITTLYEDAHYGLLQYEYASRWGNEQEQLAGLKRALANSEVLSTEERRRVRLQSVKLYINTHDFVEGLRRWDQLLKEGGVDQQSVAQMEPVIAHLKELRTNDAAYDVAGLVSETGGWSLHLFKRHFQAVIETGSISDVKLKCAKGFVRFTFDPKLEYTVPERFGECTIELLGTPGTRFKLEQS